MNLRIALLTTTLLVSPLHAQLTISGETKVKPYKLVKLTAQGAGVKDAALVWDISDDEKCDIEEFNGRFLFTAPPGVYKVKVRALRLDKDGKTTSETARITVTIEGEPKPPPPKKAADPIGATCKLRFGNAGCTATILWPRRPDGRWDVLTASHCTGDVGSNGQITLKDGRTFKVTVVARNRAADLSWLVTAEAPAEMPYAVLAADTPHAETKVFHIGYGVDRPGNRETGRVQGGPAHDGKLSFKLSVSSGDSGGGIFREDTEELVAAVCCTTGMARNVTMFGGGCATAWSMRPKSEETAVENPIKMPDPPAIYLFPLHLF